MHKIHCLASKQCSPQLMATPQVTTFIFLARQCKFTFKYVKKTVNTLLYNYKHSLCAQLERQCVEMVTNQMY